MNSMCCIIVILCYSRSTRHIDEIESMHIVLVIVHSPLTIRRVVFKAVCKVVLWLLLLFIDRHFTKLSRAMRASIVDNRRYYYDLVLFRRDPLPAPHLCKKPAHFSAKFFVKCSLVIIVMCFVSFIVNFCIGTGWNGAVSRYDVLFCRSYIQGGSKRTGLFSEVCSVVSFCWTCARNI